MPDAQNPEAFDPRARYIAANGLAYRSFLDYFVGNEPEADDRCNGNIQRYLAQGRSEAFCRCFREGYDQHLARIGGPGAPDREAIATFHAEAIWRERAAQGRIRGVAEGLFPPGVPASTDRNAATGVALHRAFTAEDEACARAFGRAAFEHPAR